MAKKGLFVDIKAARTQYDCREEARKMLGDPVGHTAKSLFWSCPFHHDNTPSFHVYQEGYKCFGCGAFGDIFDLFSLLQNKDLKDILHNHQVDPYEEVRRKNEYAERTTRQLEENILKAQTVLNELRELQTWVSYHENLDDHSRVIWETRGVPIWYQDWMCLGYDPNHKFWAGEDLYSATLTMPIYEAETRNVLNVKHRILGDVTDKLGKYRPERSGLPASIFPANPDLPISGQVLVVEGEIKSMVAFVTLNDADVQVAGLPSKNPNDAIIKQLKSCEEVILCLDPDADPRPLAREIGYSKVKILRTPEKIDDYILINELDGDWLKGQIRQARKA